MADLTARIAARIRHDGPLSFATFMEQALYDAEGGYYSRDGAAPLGPQGDFITASDAGEHFGRCLARQLGQIDELIGPLEPFDVLEFGAGRGLLARDIITSMAAHSPALAARLRYRCIDRSPAMREQAARNAPEATVVSPEELGAGYRGCILAVELFDALPVHRLARRGQTLVEIGVGLDEAGRLVECELEPDPAALALAQRYGAAAAEGSEAEVCPQATERLAQCARRLDRGVLVVFDYGDMAEALYSAQRFRGTLLAYRGHTTSEELLDRVGRQDLTAHVNFSQLADAARDNGLDVLGFTTQDRFLLSNGLADVFEDQRADDLHNPSKALARQQAMQLIHPDGMGRTFKVMLLAKGCSPTGLSGLIDPFA